MSDNKHSLELKYETAFNKLNKAQKQAVMSTEGPVMTIAGPGTGKTQLLAMRVGHILKSTDVFPHNILCLTYTDAAAVEMRNRLLQFIGPDAYQVNIFTFHGFCNQVIMENIGEFGEFRDLQQISDLEEIEILRELIDNFPKDHPLKRFKQDVYYEVPKLKNLFNTMKQEDWSYDTISSAYEVFKASITDPENPHEDYVYKKNGSANGQSYKKGDLKVRTIEDDLKKYQVVVHAAKEFENYKNLLKKHERYDYHDMILWVIKKFQEKDNLLAKYQEKYQYVMVDEYQDTNGAQNALLFQLVSYWEKPNIFIVGDDDQSIYRFQGANMSSIEDFAVKFSPEIVVLEENYRSVQTILDLSKNLIQNNNVRLINRFEGLTKNLIASHPEKIHLDIKPEVLKFENITHEEIGIIRKIKELSASGVPYHQIAVLYPMHKIGENLIEYFNKEKIPLQVKRSVDVLAQPLVIKVITILHYLFEEMKETHSGDYLIFSILHFDFFHVSPLDIGKVAVHCRNNFSLDEEEKPSESKTVYPKWRDVLNDKKLLQKLGITDVEKINGVYNLLESWITDFSNVTIQTLIQKILTESGILGHVLKGKDQSFELQLLNTFFDLVKEESSKNERFGVRELLDIIKKMQQNGLRLSINKIISDKNGVNFMTTHGAKGLEFEHVFIMRNNQTAWEKKRRNSHQYSFPPTIFSDSKVVETEDLRRLFYVALTRAKSNLYLSYIVRDDKNKEEMPTQFLSEIIPDISDIKTLEIGDQDVIAYKTVLFLFAPEIKELISKEEIDKILENFSISATSLNKYLDCPLTFYFEKILKIPMGRNATMGYGNAIHYALELFFRDIELSTPRSYGSVEKLISLFDKGLKKYHSHFTKSEFERYTYLGREVLTQYFEKYSDSWLKPKKYEIEYTIKNVHHKGVPISGKLDKISILDGSILVTDYKTGKFNTEKLRPYNPEKENPVGDYWRQLVFYSLLIDADKRNNWKLEKAVMDFVEKNKANEYDYKEVSISPQAKEYVSQELITAYTQIKNHEFTKGCGKEECSWCNFITKNAPLKLTFSEDDE